jgi:hypothetical protein
MDEPFRSAVGLVAGGVTTVVLVLIDLSLSFHGMIGVRSEWVSIAGLAIASFAGALVLARLTDKRWAQIVFVVGGAALFWILVMAAAAMSDGHPDRNNDPIPLYHIIASGIAFYVMSGSQAVRKSHWQIALTFVACSVVAAVIYGRIDAAKHERLAHEEAQRQIGVMYGNVLPRLFTKPTTIAWSEPTFSNYMYSVNGKFQRMSGTIQMHGYEFDSFGLVQLQGSKAFSPMVKGSPDKQWMHLRNYLKAEGFSDDVLAGRIANDTSSVKCELQNVPSDPHQNFSRGAWDFEVAISIVGDKIFVNLTRSKFIAPTAPN